MCTYSCKYACAHAQVHVCIRGKHRCRSPLISIMFKARSLFGSSPLQMLGPRASMSSPGYLPSRWKSTLIVGKCHCAWFYVGLGGDSKLVPHDAQWTLYPLSHLPSPNTCQIFILNYILQLESVNISDSFIENWKGIVEWKENDPAICTEEN